MKQPDEISLFSIYLKLSEEWNFPRYPGETLHGFLFNLPGMARFHQYNTKPFALRLVKQEGRVLIWELATFTKEMSDQVLKTTLPKKAIIGRSPVRDMAITLKSSTNFGRLLRTKLRTQFSFKFNTPTSFRSQGQQLLLPTPELFFGSLITRWNAFAQKKITREICDEFKNILVTKHRLETQELVFSNYKIIGFTGEITYRVPPGTLNIVKKVVNSLARFALYAGVGYKTTMGLGWVEWAK